MMPSTVIHRTQWNHNQQCYDYLTKAESESFHDWCITVLFYKALHMVDEYLARIGIHPENHPDRYRFIRAYLPEIRPQYKLLEEASEKCRYDVILSDVAQGEQFHQDILNNAFIPLYNHLFQILSRPLP